MRVSGAGDSCLSAAVGYANCIVVRVSGDGDREFTQSRDRVSNRCEFGRVTPGDREQA